MVNGQRRVDTLPAYELIQRKPVPMQADPDDDIGKQTSILPPKPLPGRRKYQPFIYATLITVINVIVLAVLISRLQHLLPDTYWHGIQLVGTSCDLVNKQNSTRWQSAFQINIRGAARLTFAQAKFIDLIFDLVVGQGGRLLLAAVSYIVFMDALLRSMEITPVSHRLYASLVLSSTSLVATWQATKAVFTTKGWRAKMYLVWCALAMVYVLAFPTLIESATGYVSPSSPAFNLNNGQIITLDTEELKSCYNVTNATMLGFNNDTVQVLGPAAHIFDVVSRGSRYAGSTPAQAPPGVNTSSPFWALLSFSTRSQYYGTYYPPRTAEEDAYDEGYSRYTYNITINGKTRFFNSTDYNLYEYCQEAYCFGNLTLRSFELQKRPLCINKSYFVWGFSSIVLYVILGLQLVWTFGMYCVWLDANLASELVKSGRTIRGPFRAAADLAEALNEVLGPEYCAYTDKEIEKELERSGTMLRYNSTLRDDDGLLHIGLTTKTGARVFLSRQKLYGKEERFKRDDQES